MSQVRAIILDHSGAKRIPVEIPDDVPMGRLIPALVSKMGLPLTQGEKLIAYKLFHKPSGRALQDDETLSGVGMENEDTLSLLPTVVAGAGQFETLPSPKDLNAIDDTLNVIADIRDQLERLQIEALKSTSKLDRISHVHSSEIDQRIESLFEQLSTQVTNENAKRYTELLESVRQQQELMSNVYAPIEMPTPEQMKVKLVPSHLLNRMEETRSDETHWHSVAWAFVGAILGVIVNWATSSQIEITRPAIVVIATFAVVSILSFIAAKRYSDRAKDIRTEMLNAGVEANYYN